MSLFKSLCKYTATIQCVKDIPNTLRKAIQVAQSDTPGPVFVEFPIDTLYPYHLVKRELGTSNQPAKNLVQKKRRAFKSAVFKGLLNFIKRNLK